MRQPPPLSACFGYPITTSVAALAVVATVGWWNGADIGRLMMSSELCWRQPYVLLAPALFLLACKRGLFIDSLSAGVDPDHAGGCGCLGPTASLARETGCIGSGSFVLVSVPLLSIASHIIFTLFVRFPWRLGPVRFVEWPTWWQDAGVDNLRVPRETGNPRRLAVPRET